MNPHSILIVIEDIYPMPSEQRDKWQSLLTAIDSHSQKDAIAYRPSESSFLILAKDGLYLFAEILCRARVLDYPCRVTFFDSEVEWILIPK